MGSQGPKGGQAGEAEGLGGLMEFGVSLGVRGKCEVLGWVGGVFGHHCEVP